MKKVLLIHGYNGIPQVFCWLKKLDKKLIAATLIVISVILIKI